MPCAIANYLKLKDLLPFKGKDLKEANDYLRALELIFVMARLDFDLDALRVVLGVMHLVGEPQES